MKNTIEDKIDYYKSIKDEVQRDIIMNLDNATKPYESYIKSGYYDENKSNKGNISKLPRRTHFLWGS